jgi:DNA-binding CsgD family transcriptional regulator
VFYTLLKLQKKKLQKKAQIRIQETKLKFEEEQRQINYKHQLELEKNEKAIMQLTNENLQAEIKYKSEDLASTAMNLLQKKAFLGKLTSHLNNLVLQKKDQVETSEIRKILRQIKSDEKLDEEWDKFTDHVKNVQSDFLNKLKKAYPDLNSKELKLCAYLRMNLSSKEMAQLFSISVRGVEISRYRLRKKLKLETHQDLFEFLINFQSNNDTE